MTRAEWSAAGITVRPVMEHTRDYGVTVTVPRSRGAALLPPELARSLAHWLAWFVRDDDTPPPADPDAVRVAIQEQRAELTRLSTETDNEHFRSGLAWADRALDVIHRVADGQPAKLQRVERGSGDRPGRPTEHAGDDPWTSAPAESAPF